MKEKQNWTEKLSNVITLAGTAILMNLMFLIACIPIVTIGPAWCGLMSSVRYNIRGEGWFQGFKKGFCTRFWRSLIIWCICLPLCLFFLNDLRISVNILRGVAPMTKIEMSVPDATDPTNATNATDVTDPTNATNATDVTDPTEATQATAESAATETPGTTEAMAPAAEDDSGIVTGVTATNIANCVISGLFFALAAMVTVSLLTLNVYIPTTISNWLKNGVNFFRRPVELFVAADMFWGPLLLFVFSPQWFFFAIMIFIAAYYALAAVCGTLILKDPLIDFLIDARADGTLLAEEGAAAPAVEDEDE